MTLIERDHSKFAAAAWVCLVSSSVAACGSGTVPRPAAVQAVAADYLAVPYTPRSPPIEIVPPRPAATGDLAWADGGWGWNGDRYRWEPGAWVVVPGGAKRARWVVVRRAIDGQLFFAPSSWRAATGEAIEAPRPLARASTRPGGPAGGVQGAEINGPSPSGSAVLDE